MGNIRALPSAFVISEINERDNAHTYLPDHGLPEGIGNLPRFVVSDDTGKMKFIPQQLREYLGVLIPNDWIHTRLQFTCNRPRGQRFDNLLKVINSLPLNWVGLIYILARW